MRFAFLALALLLQPGLAAAQTARPDWARPILSNDPEAIRLTGPTLTAPASGLAVRVTVAPASGGVARLIRYESDGATARIFVRRFTGHLRNGWMLWGAEDPVIIPIDAKEREKLDGMARTAISRMALSGEGSDAAGNCVEGDYVLVEATDNARAVSAERRCNWGGASGALGKILSERAGSRNEEELYQSAIEEMLEADRAFSRVAKVEGVAAAMVTFAADDARLFLSRAPVISGRDDIAASYAEWDPSVLLQWEPSGAEISARGDMGFTWGRWTLTQPGKDAASGNYLSIWRRDATGQWRYAANIGN